ncbi:MAG: hypothetical protein KF799_04670 [Bdellovibrionales bacterium]|nr:hypothetical protein [Bdellovibrionales bacterium]
MVRYWELKMRVFMAGLALVAGVFSSYAAANDNTIEVISEETEVRFLKNFDAKIQALENYSATFDDGTVVRKAARRAPAGRDSLQLKMLPAKKKS